jgi:hypothetical protein
MRSLSGKAVPRALSIRLLDEKEDPIAESHVLCQDRVARAVEDECGPPQPRRRALLCLGADEGVPLVAERNFEDNSAACERCEGPGVSMKIMKVLVRV